MHEFNRKCMVNDNCLVLNVYDCSRTNYVSPVKMSSKNKTIISKPASFNGGYYHYLYAKPNGVETLKDGEQMSSFTYAWLKFIRADCGSNYPANVKTWKYGQLT
jgi:hypothetical protein